MKIPSKWKKLQTPFPELSYNASEKVNWAIVGKEDVLRLTFKTFANEFASQGYLLVAELKSEVSYLEAILQLQEIKLRYLLVKAEVDILKSQNRADVVAIPYTTPGPKKIQKQALLRQALFL